MTKEQLVAQLKLEYPALTYGINDEVFEMTPDQYEQTISDWADARIFKAQAKADAEEAKSAVLERLGITSEEVAHLLG